MRICIIGEGNVGHHLNKAFSNGDVKLINSRTLEGIPENYDIYLLCVSDSAIQEIGRKVACKINKDKIIAHTSGSTPMSILEGIVSHIGVLYPLQTFSKGTPVEYSEIPIFIEASDSNTECLLMEAAELITTKVYPADSDKRKSLHLASVVSCNFVNHLWTLADEYLRKHNLAFSQLQPLLEETLRKAITIGPRNAQTGPAARKDYVTMDSHVESLKQEEELRDIYSLLSQSIMNHERNKL